MSRKKVNPNRVPIGPGDYDLEQIKDQATSSIVLQEWAVILATLSNLEGMSTEKLLDFWRKMDQVPSYGTQAEVVEGEVCTYMTLISSISYDKDFVDLLAQHCNRG